MAETEDDDEWEYEYDDTETEDLYITLDLSNTPAASLPNINNRAKTGHPTRLQSRLRAINAGRKGNEGADDSPNGQRLPAVGEMQITGLHTANPLVMYNGQLLSCKWASTIGTDMFFVKPSPEDESPTAPLRSLPAVDLLAMSSAKLTATVGVLRPRADLFNPANVNEESIAGTMDISDNSQSAVEETNQASVQGVQPQAGETPLASTSFLARLNQAKVKRGENSMLVMSKSSHGSQLVSKKL
jgi:hypothetical protein